MSGQPYYNTWAKGNTYGNANRYNLPTQIKLTSFAARPDRGMLDEWQPVRRADSQTGHYVQFYQFSSAKIIHQVIHTLHSLHNAFTEMIQTMIF